MHDQRCLHALANNPTIREGIRILLQILAVPRLDSLFGRCAEVDKNLAMTNFRFFVLVYTGVRELLSNRTIATCPTFLIRAGLLLCAERRAMMLS